MANRISPDEGTKTSTVDQSRLSPKMRRKVLRELVAELRARTPDGCEPSRQMTGIRIGSPVFQQGLVRMQQMQSMQQAQAQAQARRQVGYGPTPFMTSALPDEDE